jgi:predicted RNA-binding Zn-ribbon protein involved in translation (DUF1610 family)
MEPFGWEALTSKQAPSVEMPKRMFPFHLECRSCGYEPEDMVVAPRHRCPKCGGTAWERSTRPGSLLDRAERRAAALAH